MVLALSLQVDGTSPILHLSTGSIAVAGQPVSRIPFIAKYAPTGQKMGLSISMKYLACVEQPDVGAAAMMQAGLPPRFVGPAVSALAVTENTTNQSTNIWNAFILVKSVLKLDRVSSAVFCAPPLHIYIHILALGIRSLVHCVWLHLVAEARGAGRKLRARPRENKCWCTLGRANGLPTQLVTTHPLTSSTPAAVKLITGS